MSKDLFLLALTDRYLPMFHLFLKLCSAKKEQFQLDQIDKSLPAFHFLLELCLAKRE
ncbi:hypothetical protein ACS0TY_034002 [Phlomoides rotata]